MDKQVLSIKEMQELIDMGIDTSNASLYWAINKSNPSGRKQELMKPFLTFYTRNQVVGLERFEYVPTFTLQDILEMIPDYFWIEKFSNIYKIKDVDGDTYFESKSLLEAAFNMLKWCKTNNQL